MGEPFKTDKAGPTEPEPEIFLSEVYFTALREIREKVYATLDKLDRCKPWQIFKKRHLQRAALAYLAENVYWQTGYTNVLMSEVTWVNEQLRTRLQKIKNASMADLGITPHIETDHDSPRH